jgi:hypothetical protein
VDIVGWAGAALSGGTSLGRPPCSTSPGRMIGAVDPRRIAVLPRAELAARG